ncbi:hypothetical protein HDV00_006885 [Rhizophlyctis rosea]|nr:hypothetical protein HDV00_006885 [Rhizophlyctis rosea]
MNSDATSTLNDGSDPSTTSNINITLPGSHTGAAKNVSVGIGGTGGSGSDGTGSGVQSGSLTVLSNSDVMYGSLNAAIFGALVVWAIFVLLQSITTYRLRRKPLYLLNLLQSISNLIKTFFAAIFATVILSSSTQKSLASTYDWWCDMRSPLINIPMVIAWDLIYGIMVLKLMLFVENKWVRRGVMTGVAIGVAVYTVIVCVSVALRESKANAVGMCTDRYPRIYKYQYVVEIVIEIVTTITLLWAIASKNVTGGVFAGTREILKHLVENEHLRVFLVIVVITGKIVLTWIGNIQVVAITHAFDSARSAVISWALLRTTRQNARTRIKEQTVLSHGDAANSPEMDAAFREENLYKKRLSMAGGAMKDKWKRSVRSMRDVTGGVGVPRGSFGGRGTGGTGGSGGGTVVGSDNV